MKLLNELKSEYRNGSLDCPSDMTQERAEPVFCSGTVFYKIKLKDFQGIVEEETFIQ